MRKHNWLSDETPERIVKATGAFWEVLAHEAYPISKGELRIPISIEPFVLDRATYDILSRNLLLVVSAARKLAARYHDDAALRELIALPPAEARLVDASKDEPFVGVIRADLFFGSKPQIVELNADFPDGLFMHDVTARTIADMAGDKELSAISHADHFHYLLESEDVKPHHHVFIAYNKGRFFLDEFALSKLELEKRGWKKVSMGAIEDLVERDGTLYFDGEPIDIIRRGVEMSKLHSTDIADALHISHASGSVRSINNFRMRLLGHKALLVALWDPQFRQHLTRDEWEAVQTLVPETIRFDSADMATMLKEQDRWVLKPSGLTEGEGVAVGASLTKYEWEAAIKDASSSPRQWIFQKKVDIPAETFTFADTSTGEVTSVVRHYDLNPHVIMYRDKLVMGNILVRFSESTVLNVMKGGGITYAFVK